MFGSCAVRSLESSVIRSVVFWYGAQGLRGGKTQAAPASLIEGISITRVGGISLHPRMAVEGVSPCGAPIVGTSGPGPSRSGAHAEARRAVGIASAVILYIRRPR